MSSILGLGNVKKSYTLIQRKKHTSDRKVNRQEKINTEIFPK